MKTLTLTVALFLAGSPPAATEFQQSFGSPEFHRGVFAAPTGDNGCVFAGHASVDHPKNLDMLLVKVAGDREVEGGE